jgi:hypothetical protein
MATPPDRSLAPYNTALALRGNTATSIFCPAPTILEAINHVLRRQGMPLLWAHADGTIGHADPLVLQMEYSPSPFVN